MKTIQVFVIGAILTTALSFSGLNVRIVTAKSKPLSTAGIWNTYGPHSTGFIPRLEPGLRYVQARINFLSKPKDSVRISLFNLNQLSNFDPEERKPNRFSRLFGDTGASIGKLTARLIQQATKLVAAVLLFASGSLLSMRPLPSVAHASELHATFVKKAGVSLASITAAAIATGATMEPAQAGVFNFNRDMLKLKRYSQLTPTERLATTPLYFVANSRGNSYLQSDAQVKICV